MPDSERQKLKRNLLPLTSKIVSKLQKYQEDIRLQREEALQKKNLEKQRQKEEDLKEKARIDEELHQLDLLYKMEKGEVDKDYTKVFKVSTSS